jgi:Peptidase A4 family
MMKLRRLAVLGVVAVAVGPALALAGPAGAAPARPASAARTGPAAPFIPGTPLPNGITGNRSFNQVTSSNWSGYAVQATEAFTTVTGSWTEPAVSCSSKTTYSAFWVGLDGYADTTVEQLGTEADCTGGRPVYSAWYEMYPAYPVTFSNPVLPGDVITAKVVRTGTSYKLSMTDTTEGWSRSVTKKSTVAENASAEWIAEAPCCTLTGGVLPLATFGTVKFTGGKAATGARLKAISKFKSDKGPHEISMTKGKTVIAQPSALTASGTGFSVTREG